ncbi:hypothetical protein [Acidithiobacillus sp.]|uniref:hypothetical protein n=1 Tax=Acidithiobacillus sp. TaxID=1872118 RepID=UPI0025BD6DA3|nr:hypothetical protein [Acidithiobacillus sp.]
MQILAFSSERPRHQYRQALWDGASHEALLLDFTSAALEADLDQLLEQDPDMRPRYILVSHSDPDLNEAAERLALLLPDARLLLPSEGNWDQSAIGPLFLGRQPLQLIRLGNGHWGVHAPGHCLCTAVWDRHGRWRGDEVGYQRVRHLPASTRLYSAGLPDSGLAVASWHAARGQVLTLAQQRKHRAA